MILPKRSQAAERTQQCTHVPSWARQDLGVLLGPLSWDRKSLNQAKLVISNSTGNETIKVANFSLCILFLEQNDYKITWTFGSLFRSALVSFKNLSDAHFHFPWNKNCEANSIILTASEFPNTFSFVQLWRTQGGSQDSRVDRHISDELNER